MTKATPRPGASTSATRSTAPRHPSAGDEAPPRRPVRLCTRRAAGNDVHGGVTNAWSISGDFAALTLRSGDAEAFLTFLGHAGVARMVSRPVLPASAAAPRCAILGRVWTVTLLYLASLPASSPSSTFSPRPR